MELSGAVVVVTGASRGIGRAIASMTEFIMDDPGGRKWRPQFRTIFEEGRDWPPALVAHIVIELVSGRADHLTGRYFPGATGP